MTSWTAAVDLALLAYIGFSFWRGYRAGLLVAIANLLGLAVSLFLAFLWYQPLAGYLQHIWHLPLGILNVFSFLLIAFIVDGLLNGLLLVVSKKLNWQQSWLTESRYPAAALGVLHGLIMLTYLVGIFASLPIDHPSKQSVKNSLLAQPMLWSIDQFDLPIQALITPALNDISQLFTIEPDSDETVKLNFSSDQAIISIPDEQALIDLANQERAKLNLPQLTMDSQLRAVARQHSQDMYKRGYFSHYSPEGLDPFDRLKRGGVHYLAAGENLALAPTVQLAHTGLMNSPGHRRNILDSKYRRIGVGAYRDSRYGIMFTQVFSN